MYASSERLNEQANPCMSELYKSAEEIVRDHAHRVFEARSVDESLLERVALVWPPRHRVLATVLFTDIVDSISRQQRLVTGNEVNCCSNTRSLCEGSWRGSVAGR